MKSEEVSVLKEKVENLAGKVKVLKIIAKEGFVQNCQYISSIFPMHIQLSIIGDDP